MRNQILIMILGLEMSLQGSEQKELRTYDLLDRSFDIKSLAKVVKRALRERK